MHKYTYFYLKMYYFHKNMKNKQSNQNYKPIIIISSIVEQKCGKPIPPSWHMDACCNIPVCERRG